MKRFLKGCLISMLVFIGLLVSWCIFVYYELSVIEITPIGHTLEPESIFNNHFTAVKDSEGKIIFTKVLHFQV